MAEGRRNGRATHVLVTFVCILFLLCTQAYLLVGGNETLEERITQYEQKRSYLNSREHLNQLGGRLVLNDRESKADERILAIKAAEYDQGLKNPDKFLPAQHFFSVQSQLNQSRLYRLLSDMPKGGVLHAHDFALCSTDFLIELTYRPHLWLCYGVDDRNSTTYQALRFSREKPQLTPQGCTWELLKNLRDQQSATIVDEKLRARLTLYPREVYPSANDVWHKFGGIFYFVAGMLTYATVWQDHYYRALEEFHNDGVQYLEMRSVLPILYDLEGRNYTIVDTVRLLQQTSLDFEKVHPDFVGSRLIYAPVRTATDEQFDKYLDNALMLKENFPDFFVGFDLVSQEDAGRPLRDFAHKLLRVKGQIDFYFHAGETNWYGGPDENLLDAVALGTKRIGHGYALIKHPEVIRTVTSEDIGIEVCPISSQVLQQLKDFRNHPAAYLFARNYPVVICSDDPSFWKAKPISDDYYMAFLGIASKTSGLKMLKKLAMNSIHYSALNDGEKKRANTLWEEKWIKWVDQVIDA